MQAAVPTLELIRQRVSRGDRPGERQDGFKLALVIEGGGMRGVVSGGMVSALEFLGLRDVFDAVYGSSSGAMAGAYFVARQARFGTTIYYQCINNRKFIRKSNIVLFRSIMNTAFLLDHVCRDDRPLRASDVLRGDLPLHVVASSTTRRDSVVISDFADETEVFEALRCSINVPGVAGSAVAFRGDHLFDAALYESIPLKAAMAAGATHALVLLTRPAGQTRTPLSPLQAAWVRFRLRDQPPEIVADWLESHRIYRNELDQIRLAERGEVPGIHAQAVQVGAQHRTISQLETNGRVLYAAARAGFDAVMEAFRLDGFIPAQVLGGSFPKTASVCPPFGREEKKET